MFRLIDWMRSLPENLSVEFVRELSALEEELSMPYVTSVERIAEARGESRGIATMLLKVLRRDCGELATEIEQQIRELPLDKLEALGDFALDVHSLEELQAWLNAHE
ncbi:MAG: DUF4351 domain-containing protein [Actinobacteria bacterium ATB1]|nr:DUF4351 domain-containing protein [Actinobacteria bacterium ATB1]